MLQRLFSRPLRIDLGARQLTVRSARELERSLRDAANLSPLRLARLGGLSEAALRNEEESLQRMEQRIAVALAAPGDAPEGVKQFFDALDVGLIADDNDWPVILSALRSLGPTGVEYQRTALDQYRRYLASGQAVVRSMRANREQPRAMRDAGPEAREADASAGDTGPRQALLFDLDSIVGDGAALPHGEFNRLAKGESLDVEIGPHQSVDVLLAKHRFTIVSGEPFLLVDEHGNDLKLHPGRNVVGRSAQCDVAVNPVFRAVSRRHVIVEADGAARLRLTDISTLGTFVPRAYP